MFSSINSTHYSESLSLQPSNRSEVYAAEWRDVLDCEWAPTRDFLRAVVPLGNSGAEIFAAALRRLHPGFAVVHEPSAFALVGDKAMKAVRDGRDIVAALRNDPELKAIEMLLLRKWHNGQVPIAQAVPSASIAAEPLAERGAKLLFLHTDLETHLTTTLWKHREEYEEGAYRENRMRAFHHLQAIMPPDKPLPPWRNLTVPMRIALNWVGHMLPLASLVKTQGDAVYALHFDSFGADPSTHLKQVAKFWALPEMGKEAERLSGTIFKDLKDENGDAFDLFARPAGIQEARGRFAKEVSEGVFTARAVIDETFLKSHFSSFGKCMFERCEHYRLPPHALETFK